MTTLNRLTTLERVRDRLGITTNNDDLQLTRLIDEVSRFILSYLQRPSLAKYVFNDVYDGSGSNVQILRHFPVNSVALVTVDNNVVSPSSFSLEAWSGLPPGRPQAVILSSGKFSNGYSNVNIVYTAGFVISGEAAKVPSSANYSLAVSAPHGSFACDNGVTYALSGASLLKVAANPSVGQYSVANGIYNFAAADANASILLNYSYIPADIEHACIDLVSERYRYKNRIGESMKMLSGHEKIVFSSQDMSDFVKTLLQPYRRVVAV